MKGCDGEIGRILAEGVRRDLDGRCPSRLEDGGYGEKIIGDKAVSFFFGCVAGWGSGSVCNKIEVGNDLNAMGNATTSPSASSIRV